MTTAEVAQALGITPQGVVSAIAAGRLSASRAANGTYRVDPAEVARYKGSRKTPSVPKTQSNGKVTKARQLADLLAQMSDLAAEANKLVKVISAAQAEYAFRLIWDHLDDDRRALLVAFVETQVRKGRRAS